MNIHIVHKLNVFAKNIINIFAKINFISPDTRFARRYYADVTDLDVTGVDVTEDYGANNALVKHFLKN